MKQATQKAPSKVTLVIEDKDNAVHMLLVFDPPLVKPGAENYKPTLVEHLGVTALEAVRKQCK